MSAKLLLLVIVLCASQLQTTVLGQKTLRNGQSGAENPKPYHSSGNHLDEQPEYEREKGLLIRQKRAAITTVATPTNSSNSTNSTKPGAAKVVKKTVDVELSKKRVKGFITVFGALTGTLIFLCFVNIGLFVWLLITLKKIKKP